MRCKCCNNALKSSEIIWYPKQQRHEDLCNRCRTKVYIEEVICGFGPERYAKIRGKDDER